MSERINPTPVLEPEHRPEPAKLSVPARQIDMEAAFDPELRQGRADMALYEGNRPFQDAAGNHADQNGNPINPDEYFDQQRAIHYEESGEKPYEQMGVLELARSLARAEMSNDKTRATNINEVLFEKLEAETLKASPVNGNKQNSAYSGVNRPNAQANLVDPADSIYDRVADYYDSYKKQLTASPEKDVRNRIDANHAQVSLNAMKDAGVPDDVLQKIPAEHFYPSSDPDSRFQEMPEVIADWIGSMEEESSPETDNDSLANDDVSSEKGQDNDEAPLEPRTNLTAEEETDRDEILEDMGVQNGRIMYMDENGNVAPIDVVDAYYENFDEDGDADAVYILQRTIEGENGEPDDVMTAKVVTSERMLKYFESSDERILNRGRRNLSGDALKKQIAMEDSARERKALRAAIEREKAEELDANKPSIAARAKMHLGNLMTRGGEGNEKRGKKGKFIAAAVGVAAVYLVAKGVIDQDTASNGVPNTDPGTSGFFEDKNLGSLTDNISDIFEPAEAEASEAGSEEADSDLEDTEAWTDKVEAGDGITNSIIDYAESQGRTISPEKAYEIFQKAQESGLINESDISNISQQNVTGGVGFTSPGRTTFSPEIIEMMNKELDIE